MGLHRCSDAQSTLETMEVVIGDVLPDHTSQLLLVGEPPAIVAFPFEDAPEALHRPIVNTHSNPGHALGDAGHSQFVMGDLGSISTATVNMEQGMGAGIGLQYLIQSTVYQSNVIGIPDGEGDNPSVAQVQDGAQMELVHGGACIVVELRHIAEPLFIGVVCVKPAVQYILRQMLGRDCRPGAAPGCVLYRRVDPQAAADAQRSLVIDRRMIILVQIVPNAAVSLVRTLPVDLLHQLGDMLILGDAVPGFPGAPPVVTGPGNMQCAAGCAHRKSLVFGTVAHRLIPLLLPELPIPPVQLLHFFSQIQLHFQQFILLFQPGALDPQGLFPTLGRLIRQPMAAAILQSCRPKFLVFFHPAPQGLDFHLICLRYIPELLPAVQTGQYSLQTSLHRMFFSHDRAPVSYLEFLS